jgi:predicted Zn finger-like uncharacterized protein
MSLATRCTQCGTIFKVVQDQLKVSEGWVRCGRCQEVFNALEGLFDLDREAPPARQTPPSPQVRTTMEAASPAPEATPQVAPQATAAEGGHTPTPPTAQDLLASEAPHPGVTHFDLDLPPGEGNPAYTVPSSFAPSSFDPSADAQPPTEARNQTGLGGTIASDDIDLSGLSALNPLSDFSGQPKTQAPVDASEQSAYPETSEIDALDSRYLLPNEEAPLKRHRKRRGPEFADAQFPQDLDAEGDWDEAWPSGPGELDEAHRAPDTSPLHEAPAASSADHDAAPEAHAHAERREPSLAEMAEPHAAPQAASPAKAPDPGPSTLPSRFGDDFQPEVPVLAPSQRSGKPGTRGRTPQPEAHGFVKQAERRAIWRHPLVRGLLVLLALGMSTLLAGQAAHHWRNELAAQQPALAPWLVQWCELTHCRIEAPRQIDDLQVDSIQLVRTPSQGEDTYRLTAIIHNRSDIALSWPQLDLNLTDANGQLLVRRVFQVADARLVPSKEASEGPTNAGKPAPLGTVPTNVPANTQTTVQWQLRAPDLKLAGYTAELFYP